MIVCFSNKIYSNPLVSSFFKNIVLFDSSLDVDEIDLVIGWGYKKTSNKARSFASYYNIKYVAIEDAFIRSLGLGVNGACSYGLIIDYSGIYYSEKSDLYDFILNDEYTTEELHLSKKLINFIVDNNISKYNCFNSTLRTDFYSGRVLLVDQTFGDASVTSSGCSIETFKTMLDDALLEYGSKIILKVHPDVLAGKKKSYLFEYAKKRNVEIVAESLNPISLLKQVDSIFTVCSQLGFEALLLGKKVYVYGKPFYAGCGLTIDRSSVVFKKNRSIEELFYSSYIKYCKYFNPFTLESISLETVLFLLKIQMQAFTTISSIERLVGFSSWKRKFIPDFFHMNNDFSFGHYDANKNCAIWASYYFKNNIFREDTKNSIVLVEDGFLRSVGLGVDHNRPYSLVFDTEGIYYDSTKPSKLENIINYQNVTCYERLYAKELISKIIELGFTKYNVGDGFSLNIPVSK
jgi:capsular polysaccharide export protein